MKYRAILDEELKSMSEPPEDNREVLVFSELNVWKLTHAYRGEWRTILVPGYYRGWVYVPRLEEVK